MSPSFRSYLVVFTLFTAVALTAVGISNLLVDPFNAHPTASLSSLGPYKHEIGTRTAKAEIVDRGDCGIVVLGSSRAEVAFPTQHDYWGDRRVCNLGLPAANMYEVAAAGRFALDVCRPEHVIIAADFRMFNPRVTKLADFDQSLFNRDGSAARYYVEHMIGLRSVVASWQVLESRFDESPSNYTLDGQCTHLRLGVARREQFKKYVRRFVLDPPFTRERADYGSRLSMLVELVQMCSAREIPATVVISAVHAVHLGGIREAGLWGLFESWRRDLVDSVGQVQRDGKPAVWDFTGYTGYVAEPIPSEHGPEQDMLWYWDPSHCRSELGIKVARRVLSPGDPSPDLASFGVQLTSETLETHERENEEARERYLMDHPVAVQVIQEAVEEVSRIRAYAR